MSQTQENSTHDLPVVATPQHNKTTVADDNL